MIEQTLLLIKPDGVRRGLTEEVLSRIRASGLAIKRRTELNVTKDLAEKLYKVHEGKGFYQGLIKLITSGPLVATLIEGENAVKKVRDLMGATDPRKAERGTIRGDLKEADRSCIDIKSFPLAGQALSFIIFGSLSTNS